MTILYQQFKSTPENYRTKRSKHTQGQQMAGIIKLRDTTNKIKTKGKIQRTNEINSWFSEKANKTDKLLSKLTKRQRENIQINKTRNEKENITTAFEKIQRIIKTYFKNLYCTKQKNPKKFLINTIYQS